MWAFGQCVCGDRGFVCFVPPGPTHTPSAGGGPTSGYSWASHKQIAQSRFLTSTEAFVFQSFNMEKLVCASMGYTIFGLASGLYWRELTRHHRVSDDTSQLRVLHAHCFSLGSFFFLCVLLLEKSFSLTQQKNYNKFYITYNIGLGITLMMMMVHGTLTVLGADGGIRIISWTAGLGHLFMSVGFAFFYHVLSGAVRASLD
ncbi:hypothetical protein JKF63_06104 [Porcisia hertigi]|uniref:Uncharacterized protein n=1 Tax=Porcisia hertigi TaxID=2761500 RepID=A0A836IYI3_9TRYP|nr:hypothetical protein JKF63_06104 [Porcisia hertigi]